ncbi:hypothetical protein TKK_0005831 [Trichogramma kaykai]|uniref:Protein GAMETE EXPRESSED 1 n=1 Tax=Trichogramma kaykai TaxID=54128 RepID=A0ABD2XFU2_9HYME
MFSQFVWIKVVRNFFLINVLIASTQGFRDEAELRSLGEKELQRIKEKAELSNHGECWHNALRAIKTSCDKLNDNEHSILALHLANCFLEDSGHDVYSCHLKDSEKERRQCINTMTDRAFGVYNEFYIYSSHICTFLNHELWQAETHNTIKNLYEASSLMKKQLLEASQMQGEMLESQREGLKIQNQLLDNGKELESVIQNSSKSVMDMVYSFKESVNDQKELLFQIFSNLEAFQNWIISEVSWCQSILYYSVSCILSALFTSSKKTSNARIVLFTTHSVNVILERMLIQHYDNIPSHMNDDKINIVYYVWLIRKTALLVCLLSLFYAYFSYKDEYTENHRVLKRIEHHLDNLQSITRTSETSTIRYSKRLALKRIKSTGESLHQTSEKIENLIIKNNDAM